MNRLLKLLLAIFFLLPGNAIYAQSDGGFTATPTEGCAPLSVQFTSNVGTNSAYTHNWTFGNNNGSGFANPTATYTTPGTYTVTHTVNGPNGQGTATKTITVHPSPVADFTATPTSVCPGTQVTFTFTGSLGVTGSANYSWVFGNGASPATGSGSPVTTTYTDPGTNNVTLTVKNSKGCVASIVKPAFITVKEKPVVNFTASPKTDYCANETATVTFNPTVTGGAPGPYTYSWDLDGATSTQTSPTHTYNGPAPAQYTIKLTVKSNNGCSETITRTNYIKLHNPKASFTSPVMACMYTMVNFTNLSTTPGASFTWDFGDGSATESTQHGAHMYHSPGMYTVKLITSVGGCTDTAIGSIIIRPQPAPAIIMTPAQPCPAPQTICFSTSKPMLSYNWAIENENGINLFTTANPCLTFGKNGYWPVVLRVADSFGCKDTVIDVVKIYPLKIVSTVNYLRSDSGCVNFLARFTVGIYRDSNYVYPYGIKSVKWKFGDGDSSTAISPAHVYTDSGHFWPTVEVETNNGCIIRDTLRVATGYKPIVDSFEAIPTSVCPKTIVYFTGHVRGFKPLIYHWGFGDGGGGLALNDSFMSHNYSCLDSYTVVLQASHNGCYSDTVQREKYIEVLPPCADFVRAQGNCHAPLTGYFQDSSKKANRVLWKFGDGDTSTQRNPIHTYAAPGKYTVWLIAYNDSVGCVDSIRKSMYFGPNEPDFVADKRQLCVGDSVHFQAYLNGDTSQALFDWWIDGILYQQKQDSYVHTFNTPGVYTVTVTSKDIDRGCPDTITKIDWITVGGPTAGFTATPTHVCNPDTINFNDTSFAGEGTTLLSRRWFFGTHLSDTVRTTGTSVSKYYDTTGDFDIGLIVRDNLGCADTVYNIQHVHVLKPIAAFSVASPLCVGGDALFTNGSINAKKSYWIFGDGGTDTTHPDATHIYNAIGVFNTQLVVTDSLGCKDTSDIIPVTATKPIADFTVSDSISVCAPLIVNFDGRPSIRERNYEWHFDDGSSPGFKNTQTVAYNNPKEYKVKLIVKDSLGCKDSITKPVRVLGYAGAFTYSPVEGCVPLTVNFTSHVLGKIPTIIWDFGDGNSFLGDYQQPNVTYTYTKPGKFLPRLIFNNGLGCKIGSEGVDTILADDAIADFETGPACEYSVVEFINKSYGVVKPLTITHWEFHDGSFSALVNPKRKYGAPGKYRVQLYVKNQNGCEDTLEKDITIHTPIEVNAGGDTIICLTDSAQLKPSGGVSYEWSPGATLSCTNCPEPYAFPKVKTLYTVISTDINGCHDTATAEVDIKTHVTSIVGDGGEICQGEVFTLQVTGARTYQWSPSGSLDDYTSASPKASPWEDTRYRVIAYEGSCVPDTSEVDLVVHPKPTVSVRGEQTIVAGTTADLLASGDHIVRFLWSPASTLSCETCSNPVASPFKTTTYTVKVFSKFECVDSANVTITILCDEKQLFVPNTFTPNGDGVNDIFMVRGTGINTLKAFRVYNRWGQVMFERSDVTVNDKAYGWDGTFNGAQLPPDVYVWTVEAYCENGDLLKLKGDVTIIR